MRKLTLGFVLAGLGFGSSGIHAATIIEAVSVSPDITISLGGQVVTDEDVAFDNFQGAVSRSNLGALPSNAELTSFHRLESGDTLFSFDTTVMIDIDGSGAAVTPQDIIRSNEGVYSLEFDGSAFGVPYGARIDGVSMHTNGDLLMSFDISLVLDAVTMHDEDLARFDGAAFSLFLDGSDAGVPPSMDLDAVHFLPDHGGNLLLSFDVSGLIGGVNFADEDVLEFDVTALTWRLAFDGSATHPEWLAADLGAIFAHPALEYIFLHGFETNPE